MKPTKKAVKPTVKKPATNTKTRKTFDVWCIYGNYGYGWDLESVENNIQDAKMNFKLYKENGGGSYIMVKKRTTADKIKTLSGTKETPSTQING